LVFPCTLQCKARLVRFCILTVHFCFGGIPDDRKGEKELYSAALEFRSDRLIRRLPDYPDLEVRPNEITTIKESAKGLTIKTVSRPKALFVSSGLIDYDDFRNRLFAWAPMAKVVASRDSLASNFLTVLFCFAVAFGLFGTPLYVMYTAHRALIIPLSLTSFLAILGMIVYSRRSPHLPISSRNTIWILLLLPLAIMIARIWK
jgi:hypothetical protein